MQSSDLKKDLLIFEPNKYTTPFTASSEAPPFKFMDAHCQGNDTYNDTPDIPPSCCWLAGIVIGSVSALQSYRTVYEHRIYFSAHAGCGCILLIFLFTCSHACSEYLVSRTELTINRQEIQLSWDAYYKSPKNAPKIWIVSIDHISYKENGKFRIRPNSGCLYRTCCLHAPYHNLIPVIFVIIVEY